MTSLGKLLRRYRHRRGFGVHSPFAFSLIRDLSAKPGAYYRDMEMSGILGRCYVGRQARLLHRLVARLDPEAVVIPEKGCPREFLAAIGFANGMVDVATELPSRPSQNLLMVASAGHVLGNHEEMGRVMAVERGMLMTFGSKGEILEAAALARRKMGGGWALVDTRTAIFVSSPDTPYVECDVKLV